MLTNTKRCTKPFRPSAGCTVATREVAEEASLAILTFQRHHNNVPVYVMADAGTAEYLSTIKFAGPVFVQQDTLSIPSSVKKHNDYHRPDAILWKMNIFDRAVRENGDAVFFDSDIVFFAPLDGPEDCEVALSHNLAHMPADRTGQMYGFFNAGLVWTCNEKYPNWWKASYLRGEGFYEQAGMNLSPRMFRCGYFDFQHNYGFWRGPLENRSVKSLHLHLNTNLDKKMPPFMVKSTRSLRKEVWERIGTEDPILSNEMRKMLEHPERLFFIHYGKAGGVYVNNIMVREMTPGYKVFDSWRLDLNRDWNTDELMEIIRQEDTNECLYLHQHHMNTRPEHVAEAKANGWLTFTFLRHPMDVICSLYYWRNKTMAEEGKDYVLYEKPEYHMKEFSLSKFWYIIINEYPHLWRLPDYIDDVTYVNIFSEENFTDFCNKYFGYAYDPKPKANASDNPGFEQCHAQGLVSDHMIYDLSIKPEYKAFVQFLTERSKSDHSPVTTEKYDISPLLNHPPHLISTRVIVGDMLRCTPGDWHSASDIEFSFQWYYKLPPFEAIDKNGAIALPDANKDFYVTSRDDVGKAIFCVVTARNLHGVAQGFSSQTASVVSDEAV